MALDPVIVPFDMSVLSQWPWILTGAVSGFIAYCNLPSAWILPATKATEDWLAPTQLKPINNLNSIVPAHTLWDQTGQFLY